MIDQIETNKLKLIATVLVVFILILSVVHYATTKNNTGIETNELIEELLEKEKTKIQNEERYTDSIIQELEKQQPKSDFDSNDVFNFLDSVVSERLNQK